MDGAINFFAWLCFLSATTALITCLPLLCGRYSFKNHRFKYPRIALALFLILQSVLIYTTICSVFQIETPFSNYLGYPSAMFLLASLFINGYIFIGIKQASSQTQTIAKIAKYISLFIAIAIIIFFSSKASNDYQLVDTGPSIETMPAPTVPDDTGDPNYRGHIIEPDKNGDCKPKRETVTDGIDAMEKNRGGYEKNADGKCHWVNAYTGFSAKPIIYLYPTEETAVNVKLSKSELLTTTYPKYDSATGWNAVAKPNGDLTYISKSKLDSSSNGKRLYSLYWEGKNKPASVEKDGYVVKGSDTASFLEDKLARLGLSDREAEEFIIYWLPKLEHNEFNYIRFETKDEINSYMPLDISPKPDTIIRVAMDWKKLGNDEARQIRQSIREQQLPATPARTDFTVVEWGGSEIK